jgi:pimeloyl-ACP methyl ester carboxylesterase
MITIAHKVPQRFLLALMTIALVAATRSEVPAAHFAQAQSSAPGIVGNWEGTLVIGETKLRLVLRVSEGSAGEIHATVDSLDQANGNNLQVDVITFISGALHFEMKKLLIVYDGVLNKDGSEIEGNFVQGGNSLPLIFRKQGIARSSVTVKRGKVQLKSCDNPALTSDALCGKYEVYEDRLAHAGRKIALNIILLPAISAKAAGDALFYLAGGPGGAATVYAPEKFISRLRGNRDVVLVDQRGTGDSNPLNCPPVGTREDMRGYFGAVFAPEWIRACRAQLEKVANLKLYTSSIAMDDLDEVRAALGYDRINIYGGSYGSTTSLVYLRQHPEHVRAVAMFGVAPPSAKIPLSFARGVQESVNRLFADCAADSACHTAYPDVNGEFRTIMALFDKGPVEVTATNVYSKETQKVTVTRDAFVDAIRQLLYVPDATSALPALVHVGAQGNLGPLIGTAFQVIAQIDARISRGMQFSVICAEDVPFITTDEVKTTSANSFYGDARVRPTMQACAEWPQGEVPAGFLDPVKGDAPVLLVSGEIDPVTPPWIAEMVARSLPHSRLVKIHNGTHASYECVENLIADFIDEGATEGVDTSCVEKIQRPPFFIIKSQ